MENKQKKGTSTDIQNGKINKTAIIKNEQKKGMGTFIDPRDKKTYKTVKIGEQIWMAENLNYKIAYCDRCYENKTTYCDKYGCSKCYEDKTAYCDKYGRLYNWETAMKSCPAGWHLPSKAEWEVLVTTAGGEKIAGKYLKATSGWNDYAGKSGNGEDKFGFSALPGGFGSLVDDDFNMKVGYGGHWWSSSEINKLDAHARYIYNDFEKVYYNEGDKIGMYSVRCVQDTPTPPKGSAK